MDFFERTNLVLLCHQMNTRKEKERRQRSLMKRYRELSRQSADESNVIRRTEAEPLSAAQITDETHESN